LNQYVIASHSEIIGAAGEEGQEREEAASRYPERSTDGISFDRYGGLFTSHS